MLRLAFAVAGLGCPTGSELVQCLSQLHLCAFSRRLLQPLASNFLRNTLPSAEQVCRDGGRAFVSRSHCCDLETRIAAELKPPMRSLPDVRLPRTHTRSPFFCRHTQVMRVLRRSESIQSKRGKTSRATCWCRDLQQPRGRLPRTPGDAPGPLAGAAAAYFPTPVVVRLPS